MYSTVPAPFVSTDSFSEQHLLTAPAPDMLVFRLFTSSSTLPFACAAGQELVGVHGEEEVGLLLYLR
jgi:hypothetical protein